MTALSLFELDILNALQALRNPVFDIIAKALDILAARGEIFIFLTALLLIFPRTRKVGAACALALILDYVFLNLTIKPWVARIRPYDLDPGIKLITDPPHDYSSHQSPDRLFLPLGPYGGGLCLRFGCKPSGKKGPHHGFDIRLHNGLFPPLPKGTLSHRCAGGGAGRHPFGAAFPLFLEKAAEG